jgi:opacity protein-like surface antigen
MKLLTSAAIGLSSLLFVGISPLLAEAQMVGLGPRFSFVRGDLATETPSSRLLGGSVRLRASARTSLELSMDYRVTRTPDLSRQTRETPVQASLLVMPFRTILTPYALAGVGVYSQRTDVLGAAGDVTETSLSRRIGWHAGFGGEFSLGRHAAVYADYRYRFVSLDRNPEGRIPFSHQGSMWTGGVAFYF